MVKEDVLDSLKTELQEKEGDKFNENLLNVKVDTAYREVKAARKYPQSYSVETVEQDMEQFYSQIREIAYFDYEVNVKGLSSYSADGASTRYVDRNSLFYGIVPIGGITS